MITRRSFLKMLAGAAVVAANPIIYDTTRATLFPVRTLRGLEPSYDDLMSVTLKVYREKLIQNIYNESPLLAKFTDRHD